LQLVGKGDAGLERSSRNAYVISHQPCLVDVQEEMPESGSMTGCFRPALSIGATGAKCPLTTVS